MGKAVHWLHAWTALGYYHQRPLCYASHSKGFRACNERDKVTCKRCLRMLDNKDTPLGETTCPK